MPIDTVEPETREAESRHALLKRMAEIERENRALRTALEASRAALRSSKDHLQSIDESTTDYAFITQDSHGRITGWSRGAEHVLGWGEAEVVGQDIAFIYTPADRAANAPRSDREKARLDGRAEDKRWYLRKDGSRFWGNGVLTPLRSTAQGGGFLKILRNRTAEWQAEEELRQQLELNRAITEHAAEALFVMDEAGRITLANPAALAMFGWSLDELRGQALYDVLHYNPPEARPSSGARCALLDALDSGAVLRDHEDVFRRKDGTRVHVVCSNAPVRDRDGRITGAVLVAHNVTARKRIEAALHESRERLARLIGQASVGITEADASGRFVLVNNRFCEIVGRSAQELLNRSIHDITHPDHRAESVASLERMLETGEPFVLDKLYLRPDGSEVWANTHVSLIRDRHGRPQSMVAVVRDITAEKTASEALRASEANFRTLANAIPQLAWMADEAGAIIWYNQRWFDYTGTSLAEMQRSGWQAVHHPDHAARVAARMSTTFERGEPWEDTFPLRGRDGSYRWFLSRAVPIRDGDGRIVRWFGTSTDVTDQREAESHQRLLMTELAHRVKNTLAVVQAIAGQTMRTATSLPEARQAFGARLAALAQAHDVLMQESWASASIRTIVSGAVRLHDGVGERFRIEGPDLPLGPKPALALALILHELSTNAMKYGALSVGSGEVDVAWTVTEAEDGPRLRLRWRESGGPPVQAPKNRGFGSRLIERGLTGPSDGRVELAYEETGLTCTLEARLAAVQER